MSVFIKLLFLSCALLLSACSQTASRDNQQQDYKTQLDVAQLAEAHQQYDAALTIYLRLHKQHASHEVSMALGRLYYRKKEWLLAQTYLLGINEQQPQYQEAQLIVSKLNLHLGQPELAQKYLFNVLQKSNETDNLQAVIYDYLQQHKKAQQGYLQLLKTQPLFVKARVNLVYSYLLSGDYKKAQAQLKHIQQLGINGQKQQVLLAVIALLQNHDATAISKLEELSSPAQVEQFVFSLVQLREDNE